MDNSDFDEEVYGKRLQVVVETSCASELRKVYPPTGKRTWNYWLSEELTVLRRMVMWTRRKAQRAMAREMTDALQWSQEFRKKKREMKKLIRSNKENDRRNCVPRWTEIQR